MTTVKVTCRAIDQGGNPVSGAVWEAKLSTTEQNSGFVSPEVVRATSDAAGVAELNLWPNALGVASSSYTIKAINPDTGKRFINVTAYVPNSDCYLDQILVQEPFPSVSASQTALTEVQAATATVTTLRDEVSTLYGQTNTAKVAAQSAQTAAETAQTGAQTAKSAAETAQGLADSARIAAQSAQLGAGTAQGLAEDARDAALAARTAAENAAGLVTPSLSAINTVATNAASVISVAGSIAAVNAVAVDLESPSSAVEALGPVAGDLATLGPIAQAIQNVSAIAVDVVAVSDIKDDVTSVATNIAAIQNGNAVAASAAASAAAAATSASQANTSAGAAAGSAASALAIYGNTTAMNNAVTTTTNNATTATTKANEAIAARDAAIAASQVATAPTETLAALAQSIHYGAIVDVALGDVSKDSDPLWVKRCADKSWYKEAATVGCGEWIPKRFDGNSDVGGSSTVAWAGAQSVNNPELVNGSFLNTDGWTPIGGASLSVSGGVLTITGAGTTSCGAYYAFTVEAGATYFYNFNNLSNPYVRIGTSPGGTEYLTASGGVYPYKGVFTAASNGTAYITITKASTSSATYKNIYIRKVDTSVNPANRYYQNYNSGKFYKLGATSSDAVTEVFRGKDAEFPQRPLVVAESTRVVIYDADTTAMWMVFVSNSSLNYFIGNGINGTTKAVTSVSVRSAILSISTSGGGNLNLINFVADMVYQIGNWGSIVSTTGISARNAQYISQPSSGATINALFNDAATTVLPNAPIDPRTGLAVPTTLGATPGGLSWIMDSGVVWDSALTTGYDFKSCDIKPNGMSVAATTASVYVYNTLPTADGKAASMTFGAATVPAISGTVDSVAWAGDDIMVATSTGLFRIQYNPSTPAKSMVTQISHTFNTGYQVGAVKGAWLADSVTGSVSNAPVTQYSFTTDEAGPVLSGWSNDAGVSATASSGIAYVTVVNAYYPAYRQATNLVAGKRYRMQIVAPASGMTGTPYVQLGSASSSTDIANVAITSGTSTFYTFTATAAVWVRITNGTNGGVTAIDDISFVEVVNDRSLNNNGLIPVGTLTKRKIDYIDEANPGTADLVAYSGFAAGNYLEQPFNSGLNFGTGEWSLGGWVKVPVSLPVGSFRKIADVTVANPGFTSDVSWTHPAEGGSAWAISGDVASVAGTASAAVMYQTGLLTSGKYYRVTADVVSANASGGVAVYAGVSSTLPSAPYSVNLDAATTGTKTGVFLSNGTALCFRKSVSFVGSIDNIILEEVAESEILSREHTSGALYRMGVTPAGYLTASAYDGSNPVRTATTTTAYNTNTWINPVVTYTTDGKLAIKVNGVEVASATGTALNSLDNASAILTVGNSLAHDAPFPGSIALLRAGTTVPSADQLVEMYNDELQLFQAAAKALLAGTSSSVTSLCYDQDTATVHATTSYGRTAFRNLLQVESEATVVGTPAAVTALDGTVVTGGSTSGYLYTPAKSLKDELNRQEEAAKALGQVPVFFDYTATASQTAFVVPKGYTIKALYKNGTLMRETTSGTYWTRSYDGFAETATLSVGASASDWISIMCVRSI